MTPVQKAAARLERARGELAVAVRKAHSEGASLRTLAREAGVSHETIRRLLRD